MMNRPKLLFADEPTGNLDEGTAAEIVSLLKTLARDRNKCVIVVTHSRELAASADQVLELKDRSLVAVNNYA